jgi:hypothetical protein
MPNQLYYNQVHSSRKQSANIPHSHKKFLITIILSIVALLSQFLFKLQKKSPLNLLWKQTYRRNLEVTLATIFGKWTSRHWKLPRRWCGTRTSHSCQHSVQWDHTANSQWASRGTSPVLQPWSRVLGVLGKLQIWTCLVSKIIQTQLFKETESIRTLALS